MFGLNLCGENVRIIDVKNNQLPLINEWYNQIKEYGYATGLDNKITISDMVKTYNEFLQSPDIFFACIYRHSDNELVGIVRGMIKRGKENVVWILSIFILEKFQKKGFGKETISLIINKIKNNYSVLNVYLSVDRGNAIGVMFWEKMGFQISEELTRNAELSTDCKEIVIMKRVI